LKWYGGVPKIGSHSTRAIASAIPPSPKTILCRFCLSPPIRSWVQNGYSWRGKRLIFFLEQSKIYIAYSKARMKMDVSCWHQLIDQSTWKYTNFCASTKNYFVPMWVLSNRCHGLNEYRTTSRSIWSHIYKRAPNNIMKFLSLAKLRNWYANLIKWTNKPSFRSKSESKIEHDIMRKWIWTWKNEKVKLNMI